MGASLRLFQPQSPPGIPRCHHHPTAGLLAFREFDVGGLTEIAEGKWTGRNILLRVHLVRARQFYSRLAGYDDTNLRRSAPFAHPAMRVIVGWQGSEPKGASTSEMGRFETEFLPRPSMDNRQALARHAMAHTLHQRLSWIWIVRRVQYTLSRRAQPITATSNAPLSSSLSVHQFGDCEGATQATSTVPMIGKKPRSGGGALTAEAGCWR